MPNKLIVYLDQNCISDIAKLRTGLNPKVKPQLDDLFDVLRSGVDEEKFVVPDSFMIKNETAAFLIQEFIKATRSHQKYLGQISLKSHWEIIDWQFADVLLKYLNKEIVNKHDWEIAFEDNPDKRLQNFDVDVGFKNFNFPDIQTPELQKIRDSGVSYNDQYDKEINAQRRSYKNKVRGEFYYLLSSHNITLEEADRFIDSEDFAKIPSIDIFCKLWAKDLSNKGRVGKQSDSNDIDMLSAYLPYCDVIVTDRYMQSLVEFLYLDREYKCKVFTLKDSSIDALINYLKEDKERRLPANSSKFSVFCIKDPSKNFFNPSFIDKINLAHNKFLKTGKYRGSDTYVSIFFIFNNKEERISPKIIDYNHRPHIYMDEKTLSGIKIFGYNFKSIYLDGETIEENIKSLPSHLRGDAIAVINETDQFDNDMVEHDSYVFYDIDDAIEHNKEFTDRYNIKIFY